MNPSNRGLLRVALLGVGVAVASCAHTRAEEMSAEEHQAEQDRHRRAANEEAEQYDPGAQEINAGWRTPFEDETPVVDNPTEEHLIAAERHRQHTTQHQRAAQSLQQMEESACQGMSEEARSACPLLSPYVARVRETARGLQLELKEDAPAEEVLRRMSCHLAWARTEGFPPEDAESCPLYRHGVKVSLEGRVLDVAADSPRTASLLRGDGRVLFGGPR